MPDVILFFEVHQPYRLNRNFKEVLIEKLAREGRVRVSELEELYLDQKLNKSIVERVSERCYIPATRLFLELLDEYRGFRVAYSFSGVLLEQVERWAPDALELFKQVAKHPRAEILGQTYYHSLACLISEEEFREQIEEHRRLVRDLLGCWPRVFENAELIYNNEVARIISELGFTAIITEGADRILGWRAPNYVYKAKGRELRVLLRNYRLSDDIAFRFTSRWWEEYPLTADKYAAWLAATPGQVICVCMDYETVGEHYPRETGIFEFFRHLPREVLRWRELRFSTPSEAVERHEPMGELDVPPSQTISWADLERDLSAWLQNDMQRRAFGDVARLEPLVKGLHHNRLLRLWRLLTTSDHYYYMSTKGGGPGVVHSYFSPFNSPYEAFAAMCAVLADLEHRVYRVYEGRGRLALAWLRRLPEEEAFTFYVSDGEALPLRAASGAELLKLIERVPAASLEYHVSRKHLARWLREAIGDREAAAALEELGGLEGEELRRKLLDVLKERLNKALGVARRLARTRAR
ncbi:MAG: alpha-amylase [Thermoprotei archaeon]|nr:MAG: alpha-amylase [Thermoprotei archaeon]